MAVPAFGQEGSVLRGRIVDRTTGHPLTNAQVILLSDSRTVASDSLGQYRITNIPQGASQVLIRAIGFPAQTLSVHFDRPGEQVLPVLMDSTAAGRAAQELPAVGVSAAAIRPSYRLTSFERRRSTGRGQYLTEDQILRLNAYNVIDAVRSMRGVIYECPAGRCYVRMSRAPMRCLPEYIVDEQVMNDYGAYTPIRDVVAIEVYTGPSDVPGEYAGRNAGCGVIVIHTRAGPRVPRNPG
jgi:hypothetical protein